MPKVLAIDDEYHILQLVTEFLRDQDFEVTTAPNGRVAMECVHSYQPDLILCDVEMPEMNGYEFLQELRKSPELATTPFVFLTGMSARRQMREGMDLGADDYLTKPFTFQELWGAVQSRLLKTQHLKMLLDNKIYAKEKQIEKLAYFDETTDLPNNAALEQHFWEISRKSKHLALIYFQLDQFDSSPAAQQAALGRILMKAFTNRLTPYFHPSQKNLYYLGLNQFVLLLSISNPQNLIQTYEILKPQVQPSFQILKYNLSFGLSAGIALCPHNSSHLNELLESASQACKQAQNLGGNQCQFVL
ncbi:MAG: response regulator [Candidatus Sericytochromatia bacterium]|nr:response regulator [Candidatus Sericytochromatia bacterium]